MFISVLRNPEQGDGTLITLTEELGTRELTLLRHSGWGQVQCNSGNARLNEKAAHERTVDS